MSEYDEIQVTEWLRDGIAAAKAGRRDEAHELLMRVVEANERSAQAWLWLSGVVDADEERLICLENVLTLDPHNVQARAGLKWLQERGVGGAEEGEERQGTLEGWEEQPAVEVPQPAASPEPDLFMTPDGCVYCGLVVGESDERCPHCGGRLKSLQFKRQERSFIADLLPQTWVVLAGIDVVEFFLIGVILEDVGSVSSLFKRYLSYLVGRAVTDPTSVDAFISFDLLVQIVRYTLVGLAFLALLVALGLFLRLTRAHGLGLALIALHFLFYLLLFALGFSGLLLVAFQMVLALLVMRFMFLTGQDYEKEARWERLEPDRHLVNDVDYYTRGRAYEKRGMWAKALLHWQRAVAMNPERDTYLAATARAYAQLGRYEMALAQLDEALRVSRTPEEWQPLRQVIVEAQRRATAG